MIQIDHLIKQDGKIMRYKRWNFELDRDSILVCKDDHEKGSPCQYEELSSKDLLIILEGMQSEIPPEKFKHELKPEKTIEQAFSKFLCDLRNDAPEHLKSRLKNGQLVINEFNCQLSFGEVNCNPMSAEEEVERCKSYFESSNANNDFRVVHTGQSLMED